jgi:hypothetical protein
MRMKLSDRHGRVRERALTLAALRHEAGDRLLIRFTYPNDIRGTGFLVLEQPGADDERFLYLPSLGRVRRIAGAETQESFVGTDFTYEDIGGRELDDYTYAILDENATWTPPDAKARPAWRLESRHKDASAQFPRVVSLVLKELFIVVQAEIYNRRNEQQKIYAARRLEQIEKIWTVMDAEMRDAQEKTRTGLVVEKIDYNVGLKEADFTRRALERAVAGRAERSERRSASAAQRAWRGAGAPAIPEMDAEMRDAQEKTRTGLVVETIDYNVGLKETDFTRRALERAVAIR